MLALHRSFHIVTVDYDRDAVYRAVYDFIAAREGLPSLA
jgi:esterase/lipase